MRILVTNNTLDLRAGTEAYLADISRGLRERGHELVAYSPILGDVARELRRLELFVVDDLGQLAEPPDVIHGQHHLETMSALLHFPGVPAVYTMHGGFPWEELPPRFPRILRYLAVSDIQRERLVAEHGIPRERTGITRNAVDLRRFRPRGPLPDRPLRALVFAHDAAPDGWAGTIRATCAAAEIALDLAGAASGNPVPRPWEVLGGYDLVFARGRAALEALAVGAAVVLCGDGFVGPLVTMAECERVYRSNMSGGAILVDPVSREVVAARIEAYDRADAMAVSRWVREVADLERLVDQLVDLYEDIIAEFLARPRTANADDEARYAASYLAWLSPFMNGRANERDTTVNELRAYGRSLEEEREEREVAITQERAERAAGLRELRAHADALEQRLGERDAALAELRDLTASLELDCEERSTALARERAQRETSARELETYVRSLERGRDELVAAFERERAERDITQEQLLAYARSLEQQRQDLLREHAAGIDQMRAYARGLERTLLEIAAHRPPAPTQPPANDPSADAGSPSPAAPPESAPAPEPA